MTTGMIVANTSPWKNFHDIVNVTGVLADKWGPAEMKEVDIRYPDGKCFFLVEEKMRLRPDENFLVYLKFNNDDNAVVSVSLTDPNTLSWNPNFFSYSGDKIEKGIGKLDNKEEHFEDGYSIQVERIDELQEDQESGLLSLYIRKLHQLHDNYCISGSHLAVSLHSLDEGLRQRFVKTDQISFDGILIPSSWIGPLSR